MTAFRPLVPYSYKSFNELSQNQKKDYYPLPLRDNLLPFSTYLKYKYSQKNKSSNQVSFPLSLAANSLNGYIDIPPSWNLPSLELLSIVTLDTYIYRVCSLLPLRNSTYNALHNI